MPLVTHISLPLSFHINDSETSSTNIRQWTFIRGWYFSKNCPKTRPFFKSKLRGCAFIRAWAFIKDFTVTEILLNKFKTAKSAILYLHFTTLLEKIQIEPLHDKTCLRHMQTKMLSLHIWVFVIHSLERRIPTDAIPTISRLKLASMAEQVGSSLTWPHIFN